MGRVGFLQLNRRYLWIIALSLGAMIGAHVLLRIGSEIPRGLFLPLHLVLELASIVVSFAVFATGWYGYKQTRDPRDLVIGATFLTTGLFDFVHTLSYRGMPDFLAVNTVGGAAAYWLLARLVVAIGLLVATFSSRSSKRWWLRPVPIGLISVALVAVVIGLISVYSVEVSSRLYVMETKSLTPLKIGMEYLTIGLYLLGIVLISEKRGWDGPVVPILRTSLLMLVFAETAFTLYNSPFAYMNALGHAFKIAAYWLILNALFVSAIQRPYQELSLAKEKLQELYSDAQEHRNEIERSFARIGSALSSSLRVEEALDRVAELVAGMLHVDCSVVMTLDSARSIGQVSAQRGGCHAPQRPVEVATEIGRQATAEHKAVLVNDLENSGLISCSFDTPTCLRSMICVPMIYDSQALGIITVYSHSAGTFDQHDVALLEGFAAHAAVAVQNAISYEHESRIANALQRAFLGHKPRLSTNRYDIAQIYVPAMEESLVGGDFYDVMELSGGKLALSIGDVSGKGLAAAVHTASVKYSLRAYLSEGHSPPAALELLNKVVNNNTEDDTFVTLFLGILDTDTGELVYASAGHEPAFLVCNGASVSLSSTGPALGFRPDVHYQAGAVRMEKDSVLLLYTDGVSEARRGKTLMGSEKIEEKLLTCDELASENVAKCIFEEAVKFAGGNLRDDAAILAVRALA